MRQHWRRAALRRPLSPCCVARGVATALLCVGLTAPTSVATTTVRIGVLLQNPDRINAVNTTIALINANPAVLPPNVTLDPIFRSTRLPGSEAYGEDSYTAVTAFQQLVAEGAVAVVGPEWSSSASHVSVLAGGLGVPIVSPSATNPTLRGTSFLSRVAPSDAVAGTAVFHLMRAFNWTRAAVFHSADDYGRNGVTEFLKLSREAGHDIISVNEVDDAATLVSAQLQASRALAARIFVVHLRPLQARQLLEEAEALGLLSDGHVFIASDAWATPTAFVGTTPQDRLRMEFVLGVRPATFNGTARYDLYGAAAARGMPLGPDIYPPYAADAVTVLASALREAQAAGNVTVAELAVASTTVAVGGAHNRSSVARSVGTALQYHLRAGATYIPPISGASGEVIVDEAGDRSGAQYDVVNVQGGTFVKVGHWESTTSRIFFDGTSRIRWYGTTPTGRPWNEVPDGLSGGNQLVVAAENFAPFVMPSATATSGYEGLFIDMLDSIAATTAFSYTVVPAATVVYQHPNGSWGAPNVSTSHSSATAALAAATTSGAYHIAVASTSMEGYGSSALLSVPFYRAGMSLLFLRRDPSKETASQRYTANFWAFARPFTPRLWGVLFASFFLGAVALWSLERIALRMRALRGDTAERAAAAAAAQRAVASSSAAKNGTQVESRPAELAALSHWRHLELAAFQALESTFGTQVIPFDSTSRICMIVFQFFLLIVFSAYTANLAAFLSLTETSTTCRNYQCIAQLGLTVAVPRRPVVHARYLQRSHGISNLVYYRDDAEAVALVLSGAANAVFGEEWRLLYQARQNLTTGCRLEVVGDSVNKRSMRLAYWPHLHLQTEINAAIDAIRSPADEGSQADGLHETWLEQSPCTLTVEEESKDEEEVSETARLDVVDFGGLFTLALATIASLFLLRVGQLWYSQRARAMRMASAISTVVGTYTLAKRWRDTTVTRGGALPTESTVNGSAADSVDDALAGAVAAYKQTAAAARVLGRPRGPVPRSKQVVPAEDIHTAEAAHMRAPPAFPRPRSAAALPAYSTDSQCTSGV